MTTWAYTATSANVFDLEFRCKSCGFVSPVKVEAKGAGYQGGVASRNDAAVEAKVKQQAAAGAQRWAEIFVEFCPCPKCGKRDEVAVGGYKRKSWIVGAVSGGILLAGIVLCAISIFAGAVVALFGLIGVIVAPAMAASTLSSARKKVHFPVEAAAARPTP